MSNLVLPALGICEGSKSTTQAFASVLIIDVRSASGLKNKALMGKSSPHIRITVPGATPEVGCTKEVKSNLDPEFNETMVFLMVPGADSFGIKVLCPGKISGHDELGQVSGKVASVFTQTLMTLDVVPQGKVVLGVQLLPLAETVWMPSALTAERSQREMLEQRGAALEKSLGIYQERCAVLEKALEAEGSEKEAAKKKLEDSKAELDAATKDASELKTSMDAAQDRMKFLESQTADAKAQAALDAANKKVNEYIDNSKVLLAGLLANATDMISGVKGQLMTAVGMDKEVNGSSEAKDDKCQDGGDKALEPSPPPDGSSKDGAGFRKGAFNEKKE